MKRPIIFNRPTLHFNRKQKSVIEFVSNSTTGYTPLLKLFPLLRNGYNDYLHASTMGVSTTVKDKINLYATQSVFSFRKRMKDGRSSSNPVRTISLTMMSILGFTGEHKRIFDVGKLLGSAVEQTTMLTNVPEVFVIAVIKTSDVPKIQMGKFDIKIDPSLITFLVSEKFRSDYIEINYNATVGKYLKANLLKVSRNL